MQIRESTSLRGLVEFADSDIKKKNLAWRSWPHLSLSLDQGSDMLSMSHGLLYSDAICCNITMYFDPSHGANRDFWGSVEDLKLTGFMHLAMIIMNLNHGPDESDLRYVQIRESMMRHYDLCNLRTSPIFGHLLSQMLKEREGDLECCDGEPIEVIVMCANCRLLGWAVVKATCFFCVSAPVLRRAQQIGTPHVGFCFVVGHGVCFKRECSKLRAWISAASC
jgi:hypothetical protein